MQGAPVFVEVRFEAAADRRYRGVEHALGFR